MMDEYEQLDSGYDGDDETEKMKKVKINNCKHIFNYLFEFLKLIHII
jgi:hypothetical protein